MTKRRTRVCKYTPKKRYFTKRGTLRKGKVARRSRLTWRKTRNCRTGKSKRRVGRPHKLRGGSKSQKNLDAYFAKLRAQEEKANPHLFVSKVSHPQHRYNDRYHEQYKHLPQTYSFMEQKLFGGSDDEDSDYDDDYADVWAEDWVDEIRTPADRKRYNEYIKRKDELLRKILAQEKKFLEKKAQKAANKNKGTGFSGGSDDEGGYYYRSGTKIVHDYGLIDPRTGRSFIFPKRFYTQKGEARRGKQWQKAAEKYFNSHVKQHLYGDSDEEEDSNDEAEFREQQKIIRQIKRMEAARQFRRDRGLPFSVDSP